MFIKIKEKINKNDYYQEGNYYDEK
jgi:hypothetical protein